MADKEFRVKTGLVCGNSSANVFANSSFFGVQSSGNSVLVTSELVSEGNSTVNVNISSTGITIARPSSVQATMSSGGTGAPLALMANSSANSIYGVGGITIQNSSSSVTANNTTIRAANSTLSATMDPNSYRAGNSTANVVVTSTTFTLANATLSAIVDPNSYRAGNSTANVVVTSTTFTLANSTLSAIVDPNSYRTGNSTANVIITGTSFTLANSTSSTSINPNSYRAGNSTANLVATGTSFTLANSTLSAAIDPNSYRAGNSTANVVITGTTFTLANSTLSSSIDPNNYRSGNSTANVVITGTSFTLANSTLSAAIDPNSYRAGNSTANVVITGTTFTLANSTQTATLTQGSWSVGNSTANVTSNSSALAVRTTTTSVEVRGSSLWLGNSTVNSTINTSFISGAGVISDSYLAAASASQAGVIKVVDSLTNTSISVAAAANTAKNLAERDGSVLLYSNILSSNGYVEVPNTALTGYKSYEIVAGLASVAADKSLTMRFSQDNGSTFNASTSAYTWTIQSYGASHSTPGTPPDVTGSTATGVSNLIEFTTINSGNSDAYPVSLKMLLNEASNTTVYKTVIFDATFFYSSQGIIYRQLGGGSFANAGAVNGIRFFATSGTDTFRTGSWIKVYGKN